MGDLAKSGLAVFVIVASAVFAGCGDSSEDEPTPAHEPEHAAWSYSGADGPAHWGQLDPAYKLCETGKRQSPINVVGAVRRPFPKITSNYVPEEATVENTGHSIEVRTDSRASSIELAGTEYELERFHFHTPAEEKINGKSFAASIHIVHVSDEGGTAVAGILVRRGPANPVIDQFLAGIPDQPHEGNEVPGKIDAGGLFPDNDQAFRFQGSLTSPPCPEGLIWTLYRTPITMSSAQLDAFRKAYPDNVRPIQPRNGRKISVGPAQS